MPDAPWRRLGITEPPRSRPRPSGQVLLDRLARVLPKYGLGVEETLSALRDLHAYISGSVVLMLMADDVAPPFEEGDLDVYVSNEYSAMLMAFLLASKKISFVPKERLQEIGKKPFNTNSYRPLPCVADIWYFAFDGSDSVINVIVTSFRSALSAIIGFHSTVVMNVVTYFGVVSLYGDPTNRRMGWFNGHDLVSKRDIEWMQKYRSRGYFLFANSYMVGMLGDHVCGASVNCTHTIRSLFDDGVDVTKFPQFDADLTPNLLRALEDVFVWKLKNNACVHHAIAEPAWVVASQDYIRL